MKKVLILGSGGLKIGQAGEFDYSGSQAIKALKEEGIRTILVNPNIATVQTDPEMADEVYLQPLNVDTVDKIIAKEKPDGILAQFWRTNGAQFRARPRANGDLKKYKVKVLGTPVEAIRIDRRPRSLQTEPRLNRHPIAQKFCRHDSSKRRLWPQENRLPCHDALRLFSRRPRLGKNRERRRTERSSARSALSGAPQILIEEYLLGWKELEYEVVRDCADNALTICNMENFDPMGIHTGESIVVAPSQTLNNDEYHLLREMAIQAARHFQIHGRVQCPVCPRSQRRAITGSSR